jgi:hypothetical protein
MSSGSPNCSGFTKMLTATVSHSARARVMRETWPACSAPMVGTSPTEPPALLASSRAWRQSAARSTTRTGIGYTTAGTVGAGWADSVSWADSLSWASCVAMAAPAW